MKSLSKLQRKVVYAFVYDLVGEGMKIISRAQSSKDTQNPSGTQYDSYGLAVFYNGKLVYTLKANDPNNESQIAGGPMFWIDNWDDSPERHKGWGDIPAGYGREWADMFIKEIKKSSEIPDKGFAMIIFNAAFYSKRQEEGTGLKRRYSILSQVVGDIRSLASKYKGGTVKGYNLSI